MTNTNNNQEKFYDELIKKDRLIDADDPDYEEIFKDLQGGIIKTYGRNYCLYIFVSFHQDKVENAKKWIRDEIANTVTSTYTQFQQTKDYKLKIQELKKQGLNSFLEEIYPGELCKNFFLSFKGYEFLGFNHIDWASKTNQEQNIDIPFKKGMKNWWNENLSGINDSPTNWDIGSENDIHALILLAHDSLEKLKDETALILENIENKNQEIVKIVTCEVGIKIKNKHDKVIAPFGFVDNISQPLFLKSDYEKYCQKQLTNNWNPQGSLSLALVKDPFGEPYSFGSYCVWQKLETDYERFKDLEKKLAQKLDCEQERAAALVVGRFRDGTPIALYEKPEQDTIANNFDYSDDPKGIKCPVQAHIRKVNPRNALADSNILPPSLKDRNSHQVVRAGLPYFDNPNSQPTSELKISASQLCLNKLEHLNEVEKLLRDKTDKTENIIESMDGLLFVCFQNSILKQFVFLLGWADDPKFPLQSPGIDPVIGHLNINQTDQDCPNQQQWPKKWNQEDFSSGCFYGCVNNKGGEFFFAPSISFLKKL